MKIRILTAALMMFLASYAYAGGSTCATATGLAPDGSVLSFDSIQPNSSNWYEFTASAGRSYSIQVRDDVDADSLDLTVTYYGPNSTCSNLQPIPTSIASVTDTHATEPALPASASRSSIVTCPAANFIAPCTAGGAGTYWIKVANGSSAASHYVSIGVTETTIYGQFWQMNNTLVTQWLFQNTTSQPISYTMTAVATAPASATYLCFGTIPPVSASGSNVVLGGNSFSVPGAIPTNPAQAGGAILTHNGPPGSIQSFEFWINYSTTPWAMMPVPIGPMRGK